MSLPDRVPGRRSKLFAWYVREWEALRGGEINWRWLMDEIANRKLTDRLGRAPTLQTARQTWYRAKKEMRLREVLSPGPIKTTLTTGPRQQFTHAKIKD